MTQQFRIFKNQRSEINEENERHYPSDFYDVLTKYGHIIFTECEAEYYQHQPGNQGVVFETDGRPCKNKARGLTEKRKRRGLLKEIQRIIGTIFFKIVV